MMKTFLNYICLSLMLVMAVTPVWAADDGVNVTALVDRNQVGLGDLVVLQVKVSSSESGNVEPPNVDGLIPGAQVLGTSTGSEMRSSFENGRFITQRSQVFNYQLVMNKKGTVVIPPLNVKVNDKLYKSQEIKIAVSDARKQPQAQGQNNQGVDPLEGADDMEELFQQMLQRHFGGQRPGGGGAPGGGAGGGNMGANPQPPVNPNEAFFIQATVDKTKAYVGEQITVNFYLVTRGQIRDIDTLRYPDLKGFWKEDLEMATRLNFEPTVVNGMAYQKALLVSYALFPIHAGKATVDAYQAKCTVLTPSSFGFGHPYVFTKSSMPIHIDVEDVPVSRPANYTGAVGKFRVAAQFEPPTGTVNQPVTLRVRFEGQGNAKLIELPNLGLPSSFEPYDQKNNAKFLKDGTSFKEFEVLIIPREPGIFKIPPVAISVFDPQTKKFTEISSQPLNLTVTGTATTPALAQNPGDKGPSATGQNPKEPVLPPLATEFEESHTGAATLKVVTGLIYAASLVFLLVFGFRRIRGKPKKLSLQLVLKRRLQTVRELAGAREWRRMGVEMTNTAYYILGQLSEQGGANQALEKLLENTPPSLRHELAGPLKKLIEKCEALSFAPEAMIQEMTEKSKLDGLIEEFEKVLGRAIEMAEI